MYWKLEYDLEWKCICELCQKSFNKLWSHLRMTHKMLAKDYKKQFWLDVRKWLLSEYSYKKLKDNNDKYFNLVVTENLINGWIKNRFKSNHWKKKYFSEETKIRMREQTINYHIRKRLINFIIKYFIYERRN
jgi:hypothetical protein